MTGNAQQKHDERVDMQPVLVTGATGRVGRAVIAELLGAGVPVRALTRKPATAALPAIAEVVAGDFTEPDSLDPALRGVRAVFLLWTAPLAAAAAVVERLASDTRRVVFLSLRALRLAIGVLPADWREGPTYRAAKARLFPRHTGHRTRSSSSRTPWLACTPRLSG